MKRRVRAFFAAASAGALSLTGVHIAPASAAPPTVEIGYPKDGQTVGTGPLTVTGSVRADSGPRTQVLYAVDVSGSTASPTGLDCNGDGGVTAALDDYNQDGAVGDTLDCEISGVIALNAALRAVPDSADRIAAGVVGFGSDAAIADLDPGDPDKAFVPPGETRGDRDVIPRVNAVVGSLTRGTIGLETLRLVGTGTSFQRPLDVAAAAFAPGGARWIFLISDGQATTPDTTALAAAGIRVRTFAVGPAATCAAGSPLAAIAAATGDTCVRVDDPSRLRADILSTAPANIRSVTADLDGGSPKPATIDAIGNFSVELGRISPGQHTVTVLAELTDSTVVQPVSHRFTVKSGTRYVALGDSYSSGEGVEPYVDQEVDKVISVPRSAPIVLFKQKPAFLCHRSTRGWPRKITGPGSSTPIATSGGSFTFDACSGARIVNVDTQEFVKEYRGVRTPIPLQNRSLGTDVDLVTMSFGGNDVGFVPILTHCFTQLDCWEDDFVTVRRGTANERSISLEDWTQIRIALVQNELDGLYQQVRSRVRPDTRIVVATYPRLVRVPFRVCTEGLGLAEGERRWLADRVDDFAEIVKERAPRSGIDVADVRQRFDGHAVCDGDNFITGARLPRATDLGGSVTSAASFHPNDKGTTAYAKVVSDVLAKPATSGAAARTAQVADDGTASGADRTAKPSAAAVDAARQAESIAAPGPVRTTVPLAVRKAPSTSTRVTAAAVPADPGADVLDGFPDDVVRAVAETTFAEVVIGNGAALRRMPSCESDVVADEYVPYAASGFKPKSTVDVAVTWQGNAKQGTLKVTANAQGRVLGWAKIPAAVPTDRPAVVRLQGTGANGGTALGYATVTATADAGCRQKVRDAGLLTQPSGPPPTGPDGTASQPPATGGPSATAVAGGGSLASTGTGRWLPISVGVGAAFVVAGLVFVIVARRRRTV